MERLGFGAIRPAAGMAVISALIRGLSTGGALPGSAAGAGWLPPSLLASVFYWDKFKSSSPLFSGLTQLQVGRTGEHPAAPLAAARNAAAAAAAGAVLTADTLQLAVTAAVVAVLGSDVGSDTPLVGAGLDSLGELRMPVTPLSACLPACLFLFFGISQPIH